MGADKTLICPYRINIAVLGKCFILVSDAFAGRMLLWLKLVSELISKYANTQ